ncbi:MAG: arsenic resistance protein, partial [Thermococcus sp.]|uniref:arsenic resistance protein n=1 Tax=Thermococcus sp. TaxID=35749 RepID=UPI002631EE4E
TMGLVISPLIMYGAIWLTNLVHPINHMLALGLLLAVVVPCSSMTIAYTGFTKGNIELATIVVALSFTLAIITVPAWLKVFASNYHVSISVWLLVKTILIVVITPMILGVLTRVYLMGKLGPEGFLRIKPAFPAISLLGMYTIVFLIFMEKAELIASKPSIVGVALIPLAIYYTTALLFMTFVDKAVGIPYRDHMAITFTSVGKNEGTAMAIALAAGTGLMAIAPAVTPILQIPFLVGYVKAWRKIAGLWKCKVTEEEAVPGAS